MVVAKLNRDKLQILADRKAEEARVLLENKCWTGAYYMAGLAVECALKACLARAIQQYDFPTRNSLTAPIRTSWRSWSSWIWRCGLNWRMR